MQRETQQAGNIPLFCLGNFCSCFPCCSSSSSSSSCYSCCSSAHRFFRLSWHPPVGHQPPAAQPSPALAWRKKLRQSGPLSAAPVRLVPPPPKVGTHTSRPPYRVRRVNPGGRGPVRFASASDAGLRKRQKFHDCGLLVTYSVHYSLPPCCPVLRATAGPPIGDGLRQTPPIAPAFLLMRVHVAGPDSFFLFFLSR